MEGQSSAMEMESPGVESSAEKKKLAFRAARMSRMSISNLGGVGADSARELLKSSGEEHSDGLSQNEAVANFLIACVGAGIVVFPKLMTDNGYVLGFVLLVFSATVCYECGRVILECCELAEIASGAEPGEVATFEDVADAAFGKPGQTALALTKNFYQLGSLMAYTVFSVQGFAHWLPLPEAVVRWGIVAPIFILLGMVRDLKQLAPLAPVGTGAVFIQCLAICIGSATALFQGGQQYEPVNFSLNGIGVALSVFVFGFDAIVSLPCMRPQMANIDELPLALQKGFGLVVFVCILVMFIGYFGFGTGCRDNVIDSLKCSPQAFVKGTGEVSAAGIMVNLLISCPLIFFTFTSYFESTGDDAIRTTWSVPNLVFRAVVMFVLIIVGSVLPFAKQLINLISALFGSFNSIFFPLAYFYSLRGKALQTERHERVPALSAGRKVFHMVIAVTGIVACVFGCMGGMEDLLKKLKELASQSGNSGSELVCTSAELE